MIKAMANGEAYITGEQVIEQAEEAYGWLEERMTTMNDLDWPSVYLGEVGINA